MNLSGVAQVVSVLPSTLCCSNTGYPWGRTIHSVDLGLALIKTGWDRWAQDTASTGKQHRLTAWVFPVQNVLVYVLVSGKVPQKNPSESGNHLCILFHVSNTKNCTVIGLALAGRLTVPELLFPNRLPVMCSQFRTRNVLTLQRSDSWASAVVV